MEEEYTHSGKKSSGTDAALQYTKIPNSILEQLCRIRLPGESRQILDVIIRLTYGWNRDQWKISSGLFRKMTGVDRRNVHRAIKILEDMKIIIPDRDGYITVHRINSDTDKWLSKPKRNTAARDDHTGKHDVKNDGKLKHVIENDGIQNMTSKMTANMTSNLPLGSVKNDGKHDVKSDAHKRKKEKIKKETHKESAPPHAEEKTDVQEMAEKNVCVSSSPFLKTALFLCDAIRQNGAKLIRPDVDSWAKVLSGIGDPPEELEAVITWAQNHRFWKSRTMNAENFARSYSTIRIQMSEQGAFPLDESGKIAIEEYLREKNGGNGHYPPTSSAQIDIDDVYYSLGDCQTLDQLMALWNSNPDHVRFDVLRERKNFLISAISERIMDKITTIEELEEIFCRYEVQIFVSTCPDVSQMFMDKSAALTGIPFETSDV